MKFVIDIDDTMSEWDESRDYENFVPKQEVIDQINRLFDEGHEIELFTARGMRSMSGDMERIRNEILPPLQKWLTKTGVKYTRLTLGKPWADYYIDDKNMTIDEFLMVGDKTMEQHAIQAMALEEYLTPVMIKDILATTMEEGFLLVNEAVYIGAEHTFESRIGLTKEVVNLSLEVENPSDYDFCKKEIYEGRIPIDYAQTFYEFMLSGGTNAVEAFKDFPGVKKFIEPPKSDKLPANFNTLYGPRIATQLPAVVEELKRNPNTRRAVILILDAGDNKLLDLDETIEYPCTIAVTYSIRDGALNGHVAMRSQNVAVVLQLDMFLQGSLLHEVARQVGVPVGKLYMNYVSAHIYERDFKYVEGLLDNA